jgi:general secretion pathway protein D
VEPLRGGTGARDDVAKRVMLLLSARARRDARRSQMLRDAQDIQVLADLRTNSLFVTAPPDSMGLMEALVRQIDVPPEDGGCASLRAAQRGRRADDDRCSTSSFSGRRPGRDPPRPPRPNASGSSLGESAWAGGRRSASRRQTDQLRHRGRHARLSRPGRAADRRARHDREMDDQRDAEFTRRATWRPPRWPKSITQFSSKQKELISELEARGQELSAGVLDAIEVGAVANEDANRVILTFNPRMRSKVMNIVRELDQEPPQVMIQVLILEVSDGQHLELGVEFAFQDLQWAKAGPQDTTTFDYVGGTDLGAAGSGLGGFTFTITGATSTSSSGRCRSKTA